MFYSHTFLARKGPLGTVWCAAHLQHKLKKSHYASTDICSITELIMYPEVPIALRMSGHLLLGVVRIYSKKVDYLYQDCNVVLIGIRKAFATVEVNLPEDATHAPFHSITLPDTFELDALDLQDDFDQEWIQDNHLRSQEEITIADQIPAGGDPYIAITFDEDIQENPSTLQHASGSEDRTMEEVPCSSLPVDTTAGFQDPGPSNQTGTTERLNDNSSQNFPEPELMRDSVHDFHSEDFPVWRDLGNDVLEPDRTLEQLIMEKEILTPFAEETLPSGGLSLSPQQHPELPSFVASQQAPEIFDSHISIGHASPELAIHPSPPPEQPKARQRKRKMPFDESTVLTNKFMKKALTDSSDLLRKRRNCPSCALDVWKSNNRLKKEKIFTEPLMTGLSGELCNIYKEDYVSAKSHLVLSDKVPQEPEVPHSPSPMHDDDLEIENLRDYQGPAASNILPEFMPSPGGSVSSPNKGGGFTPAPASDLGSQLEPQERTVIDMDTLPTPDLAASSDPIGSEMDTPMTFTGHPDLESSILSDIPEMMNSAEAEDLHFLVDEDNTQTGFQGTPEFDHLSARTRATAQYIKKKSTNGPLLEDSSGDLTLNKILEGKTRKICARMFSEMLVLKVCGLVDVQQEEPYGDITLKVTSKLLKDQSLS